MSLYLKGLIFDLKTKLRITWAYIGKVYNGGLEFRGFTEYFVLSGKTVFQN